jgi:hypothetical protein
MYGTKYQSLGTLFPCFALVIALNVSAGTLAGQANPVPLVNQPLVPTAVTPGGPGFTLTVNGAGFVSGTTVDWNGSPRSTTFVSGSQLTAAILAPDIATAGTASVSVLNPAPGGGVSNVIFLPITQPSATVAFVGTDLSLLTGSKAEFIDTADLNGDGKLDLIVCDSGTNSVAVLLGNGDGTFQPAVEYPVGDYPTAVWHADFNADGKLDLAVVNLLGDSVSILLGNGDGTFGGATDFAAGTSPDAVAAADFNGDGNLDLAVANNIGETASVLLGNGDGTFQAATAYAVGQFPGGIAIGDFNRDGKLDLAVTNFNNTVSILLGNGDGTFQPHVDYKAGPVPGGPLAADFVGNGTLDLAVADFEGASVAVLSGNGDGTFQPPVTYSAGRNPGGTTAADLNADGILDLAVGATGANGGLVNVLLGSADAGFQKPLGSSVGTGPVNVVAGDFNGDGKLDLATANVDPEDPVTVLLQSTVPTVSLSPTSLTFATQVVGTTSATQQVTLTNTGGAPLQISGISLTGTNPGDFLERSTCGTSIGPLGTCTISVQFKPLARGTRTAAVSITDNASGSPQTIALSGVGTVAEVTPASLSFTSNGQSQAVTLTNVSTTSFTIGRINISGTNRTEFAESNTCGSSLAGGASCTITVTFKLSGSGSGTATLSIPDGAGGSPQSVSLSGTTQ